MRSTELDEVFVWALQSQGEHQQFSEINIFISTLLSVLNQPQDPALYFHPKDLGKIM